MPIVNASLMKWKNTKTERFSRRRAER
jgi:hypothetical protein